MTTFSWELLAALALIWWTANAIGVAIDKVGQVLLEIQRTVHDVSLTLERIESNTQRPPIDMNAYPDLYGTPARPGEPMATLEEIGIMIDGLAAKPDETTGKP